MSRNIHTRDHAGIPRITNLKEYLFLKQVRANTALIAFVGVLTALAIEVKRDLNRLKKDI